jgi:ribose transport system substrate-binding protein
MIRKASKLKWLVSFLAIFVIAVALAACGGSSDSTTGASSSSSSTSSSTEAETGAETETETGGESSLSGQTIAYANYTEAAPQFVALREQVEKDADTLGVDLSVYNNEGESQKTLSNAQLISQSSPSAVLEYSPDAAIANSLEATFARSNTPCIAVNIPLGENCSWFDLPNPALCGDTGKYLGMVADKRGWNGSNTSVVIVQAAALGAEINSCMGFFYEGLQEEVSGLAKIGSYKDLTTETTSIGDTTVQVDGEALREPSFKAVSSALQNIPSSKNLIVYTMSDDSALGSMRAVEQAGRQSKTIIAGLTGSAEGLEQLRTNPSWVAQGDVFYNQWGQYLLAMVQAEQEGVKLPDMTSSPSAVLTKEDTVKGTTIVPIDNYYKGESTEPFKLPPLEPLHQGETSGQGPGSVGNEYLADTGVLQQFGMVEGLE